MDVGWHAVEYYAEVHQTMWNKAIHTLMMPWTVYGVMSWFPCALGRKWRSAGYFTDQLWIYIFFVAHYFVMSPVVAIIVAAIYGPMIVYSGECPPKIGAVIMVAALLFQEIVGHMWGGDPPSRLVGVPNAILVSVFFSVSHLLA